MTKNYYNISMDEDAFKILKEAVKLGLDHAYEYDLDCYDKIKELDEYIQKHHHIIFNID